METRQPRAARMSARRALITGVTGQDGSYLAELLLAEGLEVTGLIRSDPADALPNIEHLRGELDLLRADLTSPESLAEAIAVARPDDVYHLAAPTFVPDSWRHPAETFAAIAGATASVLTAARDAGHGARVFVATSSEIFGNAPSSPQNEDTPLRPNSPYGVAKLAAHLLAGVLRERDGLHVSSGITYNHESPRRPERFVSRKVTRGAAAISLGLEQELLLGNLDAVRDWCFAGDVMRGARAMVGHDEAGDYVLASGVGRTVRELVEVAFGCVNLDPEEHVRVDSALVRPAEDVRLVGDPSRARDVLGWELETTFEQLIAARVEAHLRELAPQRS
jgi:GDPmannose 4,6-dehydratase